jgi:hypothetical protein
MPKIKRIAASFGASFLVGLFAYIGSAVPASAVGGSYRVCNSATSITVIYAANDTIGESTYVQRGGTECRFVSNAYGGLRVDPDREAGNVNDVDSWQQHRDDGSEYGPWHNNESIIDPPNAWEPDGIWIKTDDVTH